MHIGLIGGIGPAATEFYYRGLVRRHADAGRELELTIVHAQIADLVRNQTSGQPEAQAQIFAALIERLKAAGADAAAVTSLGGHFCIGPLAQISALPLVNLVDALKQYVEAHKIARVGLLGTRLVMETGVYGSLAPGSFVSPPGDDLQATHDAYVAMALEGEATEEQRAHFFRVGKQLVSEAGADAVVLAGTDLFLAFEGRACGFPVIDSAEVHIDALFKASIGAS